MTFLSTPAGSIFAIQRIGGAKALSSGFLLLGTGVDEILEYYDAPPEVAMVWRDATAHALQHHRPGRTLPPPDWESLAAAANATWAAEYFGVPASPTPAPTRRPRLAASGGGGTE